jgi:hypothetical protein
MLIYLDIETMPCTDPAVIADIHASVKPPATYKKAESIEAWLKDEGEKAKADAVSKTSFDGLYGRICCICYAFDDGEVYSESGDDEKLLLENFYRHVFDVTTTNLHEGFVYMPLTIVGHNVAGFDLPFLKHRSIINQVRPPKQILDAMSAKPWDKCIADTMLMWSSDSQKRASMDKLCKAFGIAGKGDFDGSMVASTWPVDPQKVVDYCKDDVRRTRTIFQRITFSY